MITICEAHNSTLQVMHLTSPQTKLLKWKSQHAHNGCRGCSCWSDVGCGGRCKLHKKVWNLLLSGCYQKIYLSCVISLKSQSITFQTICNSLSSVSPEQRYGAMNVVRSPGLGHNSKVTLFNIFSAKIHLILKFESFIPFKILFPLSDSWGCKL